MREVLGIAFGDDRGFDPIVQCREKLCQRGAARLAATADAIGIDFGTCHEVVQRANAVPGAKQAEIRAQEHEAAPRILVLARTAAERGLAGPRTRILDALALAERVVGKDHVAFASEIRKQLLIARPRLPVYGVAERAEDRRSATRGRRQIEIRGDGQSGSALERQLLDAISGTLDDARDALIEWRSIERSAQHL